MSVSTDTVRPYSAPSGAIRAVLAVLATVVALAVLAVASGTVDTFSESRPTTSHAVSPTDATDMPMPEWLKRYLALGDGATAAPGVAVTTPVNEGLR